MIEDVLNTLSVIDEKMSALEEQRRTITNRLQLVAERYYYTHPNGCLALPSFDSKCCNAGVFVFSGLLDPITVMLHCSVVEEYLHFNTTCPFDGESGFGIDVPVTQFTQENLAL